ncbi:MerR family transcriptional regulator [Agromyces sp. S2-1-8]|uniref:MerR family transcriptional regulator n=1 Tax=Agromyces sp. S2-1-8 TaxID=2897180 RepID=UPI001E5EBCD6|nr:MerR family transcriptional regulator [Agromyces sp. S2-1-8]MCD5346391.1 MerR family transcriptional regulator [Agromyces sp. S2-1-8]
MRALGTGEMSRASGLSLKALRIYDASGLLVPADVDPRTGYRRYAPEQVARARTIAMLRRIDLPLAEIGGLLDAAPAEARERLLGWWAAQREDFAERSQAVDRLAASDTGPVAGAGTADDGLRERVRFETMPDTSIATIARTVVQSRLVPSFVADVIEIGRHLEREGATAGPGHWVLFHSPVGDALPGRIETAVPFTGRAAPTRTIALRMEPGARYAVIDVTAREVVYPQLLRFYDAVRGAAGAGASEASVGRDASAPAAPREWYPGPWPEDPDEIAMRVAMPLRPGVRLDPAPGTDSTMPV